MDNLHDEAKSLGTLICQLEVIIRRHLSLRLERYGLTTPQYMTLSVLKRHPEGCTMSALAAAAWQVPATMTGLVDRLAERGLVERERDPQDRRAWRARLTGEGLRLLESVAEGRKEWEVRVLSHIAPTDRAELLRLLELFLTAVEEEMPSEAKERV